VVADYEKDFAHIVLLARSQVAVTLSMRAASPALHLRCIHLP
jgi:hypothetical protein